MKYTEILTSSAATISDRSNKYGTPDDCFGAIAEITGALLGRKVTEYEVAAFQLGTKLGRARMNKSYADNYIDGASYLGFLGHFAMKDDMIQKMDEIGLRNVSLPDNALPFSGRKNGKGSAISEDALKQAMANVSAELDIPE